MFEMVRRFALVMFPALFLSAAAPLTKVEVVRVPDGGIQPQVAIDAKGVVHLVYFRGDSFHGDLFYTRSAGDARFAPSVRVNSQEGSAVAAGNIRGARLALGRNGAVYVAWNGSSIATPKTVDGKAPMLFSRLDANDRAFEPQRSLIHTASGIDGGGAVAADREGNVYVFWHAPRPGGKDEGDRRVWIARSHDDGKSFGAEEIAFDRPTGVCGCCGMNAMADSQGSIYALFRSASEMVNRNMYLLTSRDHGRTFDGNAISNWKVGYCVMSTEAFASGREGTFAAWETEKQIYFGRVDARTAKLSAAAVAAPGAGTDRKYPALAVNRQGEILLAWTEKMAWKKGGNAAWQAFDASGRPVGEPGHAEGVPAWGLVAAFAASDGTFRVVY